MKRRKYKIAIFSLTLIGVACLIYFAFPFIFGSTAYPLEYREQIQKYSYQYNLDPNWVAAVIYSESRFNPKATSRAGARGLMQIMPATGRGIATKLGEGSGFTTDSLYDPDTNIRFGTYYLRTLLNTYSGSKELALMAYNGGGAAVNSYRSRNVLPRETTGYIRIVPSAENMYNNIYGQWWTTGQVVESGSNTLPTGPASINFEKPERKSFSITDFWKALLLAGRYDKQAD